MAVVRFEGLLDRKRTPRARRQLLDSVGDSRNTVIDLSAVSHIDGAGLACLVEVFHAARRQGKACSLIGVSDPVMRTFELSRLETVFVGNPNGEKHGS